MRRYPPLVGPILGCLFIAAMFIGFAVFMVVGFSDRRMLGDPWISVPLIAMGVLMLAAFGAGFLYGAHFCCAVIQTDEEGITRRTLFGTYRLLWRNLERFEITGMAQDDYDLWDHNGRRLDVNPSTAANGGELKGEIERRIAPLREKRLHEWRTSGGTVGTALPLGAGVQAALALLSPLLLFGAYAMLRMPARDISERAVFAVAAILFGAFGLLLGGAFIHQFTRVVVLSPNSITARSLLFRREIAFAEIESVMAGTLNAGETSQQSVTIRSRAGRKLMLTSGTTPNFDCVVALLRERAGEPATVEGARDAGKAKRKLERQSSKILLLASPLYIAMFLGMPFLLLHRGRQRVEDYQRIEREGVRAEATIVDKTTSGSKSTEYLLEYRFTPAGAAAPVRGASPVNYELWDVTTPPRKATAVYIPRDPHMCHLTTSISGKIGENQIRTSWVYFAMGVLASGLYVCALVRMRLKAQGKLPDPAVPPHTVRLTPERVEALKRELKLIGLARRGGLVAGSVAIGAFMLAGLAFLVACMFVPALKELGTSRHTPGWVTMLVFSPVLIGAAGYYLGVPFGELYAQLRTRKLGDELAYPALAADLVTALQRSTSVEKSLSGEASLRLLNALTVICRDEDRIELSSAQRHFLYELLRRWQDDEKRVPLCIALLRHVPRWRDPAGIAAAASIASTGSLPDVRTAAASAMEAAAERPG